MADSELFRQFFEKGVEAYYALDPESLRLVAVSDKLVRLSGYSKEDLLSGRIPLPELIDPDFRLLLHHKLAERRAVKEDRYLARLRTADGRPLDAELRIREETVEGRRVVFGIVLPINVKWVLPEGALPAGSRLGRYEIQAEVGRGGFGIVYRALDRELQRVVAVKILIPGASTDPAVMEQFHREARVLARMGAHANLVQVLDVGRQGAMQYLAMEYVEGPTLAQLLKEDDTLQTPRAAVRVGDAAWTCRFAAKIARALHYAHSREVVHRDVKPANVLVDAAGEPRLMDFGLARIAEPDPLLSMDGSTVVGTPAYMAPEQLASPDAADGRVDIYSLGATLYHMLTRVPPFLAPSREEVLYRVARGLFRAPRSVNPAVPPAVEEVCVKAMAFAASDRYATGEEFAAALETVAR